MGGREGGTWARRLYMKEPPLLSLWVQDGKGRREARLWGGKKTFLFTNEKKKNTGHNTHLLQSPSGQWENNSG